MAPKKATIEKELVDTVRRIYKTGNEDQLTVNFVRQAVEKKLKLEDDFLKEGEWKSKSKEIIHNTLAEIESETAAPSSQAVPPTPPPKSKAKPKPKPKNGATAPKKRGKKAATPSEESEPELSEPEPSESELSEISEPSVVSEEPPKKRAPAKRGPKKRKALSDDEDEEEDPHSESGDAESEVEEPPKKKAKVVAPKQKAKPVEVPESDSDSILSEISEPVSDEPAGKEAAEDAISAQPSEPTPSTSKSPESNKKAKVQAPPVPDSGDESEMSVVIDEPPKRKKRTSKGPKKEPVAKAPRKAKAATKAAPPLDADEAKIKELQRQLVRCGVRKIWPFELKKYGEDNKAKARHLKGMLEEIGMTGRFSEAKAKEVKERRELMADLDAVKEGEKSWGLGGRGRLSRRNAGSRNQRDDDEEDDDAKGPNAEKEEASGDNNEGVSDDSDEDARPKARGPPKQRADLAFLGDDSDSD